MDVVYLKSTLHDKFCRVNDDGIVKCDVDHHDFDKYAQIHRDCDFMLVDNGEKKELSTPTQKCYLYADRGHAGSRVMCNTNTAQPVLLKIHNTNNKIQMHTTHASKLKFTPVFKSNSFLHVASDSTLRFRDETIPLGWHVSKRDSRAQFDFYARKNEKIVSLKTFH